MVLTRSQQQEKEKTENKDDAPSVKKDKKDPKKKEEETISKEDEELKNQLELLVERLKESNVTLQKQSLEQMRQLIRTSTTSMTSVPKPLKYLRPWFSTLEEIFTKLTNNDNKKLLGDILSILGMTFAQEGKFLSLQYRLSGSAEPIGSWGHEYVRHLAAEIIQCFNSDQLESIGEANIHKLAIEMVPFFLSHNAEPDACDLLIELESMEKIIDFVDVNTYGRVAIYLNSCANYLPTPDDTKALTTVHSIYRKFNRWLDAMTISLRLNNLEMIQKDFAECPNVLIQKQMAYLLSRQMVSIDSQDEKIQEILSNTHLTKHFLQLARELDVLEPKVPEDIYKSHLENTRGGYGSTNVDSARQNLASTFVNAFVNLGFGQDKLLTSGDENHSWIYKNKDDAMLSAAASLGGILLWDVEMGLTQLDKYLYSNDENIKAGALLGIGLVNCGVRNESDPAVALLTEYLDLGTTVPEKTRISAIVGLGLAYIGSGREDLYELLLPILLDAGLSLPLTTFAALSLALIFMGTAHGDLSSHFIQLLMERTPSLEEPLTKLLVLSLGLIYLGKREEVEVAIETVKILEGPLGKLAQVVVKMCGFIASGNVLVLQEMLHFCSEAVEEETEPEQSADNKKEEKEEDDKQKDPKGKDIYQSLAVLGIACIALGEEIGTQMALRQLNHLMHYGESGVRRAVPLAVAILFASNPQFSVLDLLSKYSHDHDQTVALSSILAMGLVGAGTNNARLAQILRSLASYYYKEPSLLFMVRVTQGLVSLGKGTIGLSPIYWDRGLVRFSSIAGLLVTLTSALSFDSLLLGRYHWLFYYLVPAAYPRFLMTMTMNEETQQPEMVRIPVRVGQAVDTVGQAGRPKTITGFQTHQTPVLIGYGERAELATDEWWVVGELSEQEEKQLDPNHVTQGVKIKTKGVGSVMEGVILVKKNPYYVAETNHA